MWLDWSLRLIEPLIERFRLLPLNIAPQSLAAIPGRPRSLNVTQLVYQLVLRFRFTTQALGDGILYNFHRKSNHIFVSYTNTLATGPPKLTTTCLWHDCRGTAVRCRESSSLSEYTNMTDTGTAKILVLHMKISHWPQSYNCRYVVQRDLLMCLEFNTQSLPMSPSSSRSIQSCGFRIIIG